MRSPTMRCPLYGFVWPVPLLLTTGLPTLPPPQLPMGVSATEYLAKEYDVNELEGVCVPHTVWLAPAETLLVCCLVPSC